MGHFKNQTLHRFCRQRAEVRRNGTTLGPRSVGCTRLHRNTTNVFEYGSIQSDGPVNPCGKSRAGTVPVGWNNPYHPNPNHGARVGWGRLDGYQLHRLRFEQLYPVEFACLQQHRITREIRCRGKQAGMSGNAGGLARPRVITRRVPLVGNCGAMRACCKPGL